ncbi:MAG: hypothetical protein QG597_1730, partial [Actinomycetota bacterium]|nr:hypothetical protein [Actinomycetota bacterium]
CDFNTYTAAELGPGVGRDTFAASAMAEIDLAADLLGSPRRVETVFFGGGTPTLLPAADLVRILAHIDRRWGLVPGAEVTTEANPDSVDPAYLAELRAGGFTRISLGMQSASASVLATLDRSHAPGRAVAAVAEARQAGFEQVSLDLIYGTPGETEAQWRASLEAALAAGVDHASAYALTVEPGTAMGAAVARGVLPAPDPDVAAARYEVADDVLSAAGLEWYEISNWARPGSECQHNIGYWTPGADWWGVGPGAHSHLDGVRCWHVKHPRPYAAAVAAGKWPVAGWEVLDDDARALESVMVAIRLRRGLAVATADEATVAALVADGLVSVERDRMVLTRVGRLLADRVTLRLLA